MRNMKQPPLNEGDNVIISYINGDEYATVVAIYWDVENEPNKWCVELKQWIDDALPEDRRSIITSWYFQEDGLWKHNDAGPSFSITRWEW